MVIPRARTGILALLVVSLLGGCRELDGSAQSDPSSANPMNDLVVFVFDRSTSVKNHELEHAISLTRDRVSALDHGDRVVALELLELSLDEEPRRWSQKVPERRYPDMRVRRDSLTKARFIRDARDYIARFGDHEGRDHISGTDILSTLHLVAAELQAFPSYRPTLVLYSDMLQANREMNMEGLVRMPPRGWVGTQASRGLLPDLEGLCVVVVGARNDTRTAQIVRDFWEEYFEETGAILHDRNYGYRPVQIPERPCVGT
jgi:hypothetical protein